MQLIDKELWINELKAQIEDPECSPGMVDFNVCLMNEIELRPVITEHYAFIHHLQVIEDASQELSRLTRLKADLDFCNAKLVELEKIFESLGGKENVNI